MNTGNIKQSILQSMLYIPSGDDKCSVNPITRSYDLLDWSTYVLFIRVIIRYSMDMNMFSHRLGCTLICYNWYSI